MTVTMTVIMTDTNPCHNDCHNCQRSGRRALSQLKLKKQIRSLVNHIKYYNLTHSITQ